MLLEKTLKKKNNHHLPNQTTIHSEILQTRVLGRKLTLTIQRKKLGIR